jgi:hypothetical protein
VWQPDLVSASYSEKLHPAGWVYLVAVGLGGTFGLIFLPHGTPLGIAVALGAIAALLAALTYSTPVIAVTDGQLRAGRARIRLDLTGEVHALDAEQMRHAHGPGLDARAYLCIRGWIPTGVRVALADPRDPTPYWLLSSRRPDRLAAAIRHARHDLGPEVATERPAAES